MLILFLSVFALICIGYIFHLSATIIISVSILLISFNGYKFWRSDCDLTLNSCKLDKEYFKNKIVWITGASSGIGEALSYEIAGYGAKLILSARNKEKLNKIKQKICVQYKINEENIMILPLDLSKQCVEENIKNILYDSILKYFDSLSVDILINNAGIAHDSLLDEIDYKDIYDIYNINLISPTILTRTVLPDMINKNNFGHIINISSCTAYFNPGAIGIYAATKNGLNSISKIIQTEMEYINKNIKCTLCVLGAINTGIDTRMRINDTNKKNGSDSWIKWGIINNGITPKRCAQLICNAASNKINQAWIAKNPELLQLYLTQQFPNIFDYYKKVWMWYCFPPFIDKVCKRSK